MKRNFFGESRSVSMPGATLGISVGDVIKPIGSVLSAIGSFVPGASTAGQALSTAGDALGDSARVGGRGDAAEAMLRNPKRFGSSFKPKNLTEGPDLGMITPAFGSLAQLFAEIPKGSGSA
jgi:hypothetical protein